MPCFNLAKVFDPKAIAIFGVSLSNAFNPTNIIYHKNRLRYATATYGINPSGGDLYGERIYSSLGELPEPVDLAVIGVRAELVPGIARECADAGVGGAIIISGGFAESGRSDLQEELTEISLSRNFPIIGPNCLGVFSPPVLDTFFLPPERLIDIRSGGITIVSQSGGILVDLMIKLTREGAGMAHGVSIGNRAAVDEVELLAYFAEDKDTNVIGFYIEGFKPGRGRDFAEVLAKIKKPVVFMKAGKTNSGSRAVASHTASVAGDYRVFSEVMAQYGALEARNESEFVAFLTALDSGRPRGAKNVAVITASGGHGAYASDECARLGLNLPPLKPEDARSLAETLSPRIRGIASLSNPIDLTGSSGDSDFIGAVRFLLSLDYIEGAIVLLLPYLPAITPDIGARVAIASSQAGKPIVAYVPQISKYSIFIEGFEQNGVPVSHSVEGAVNMAAALAGEVAR